MPARQVHAISLLRGEELAVSREELDCALSLPSDRWADVGHADQPLVESLAEKGVVVTDLPRDDKGRLKATAELTVEGIDAAWTAGDCAAVPDLTKEETGATTGPSAQHAVRQAKPDYVFHLAAQSFPRTSFDAPLDTLDTNVQGTARVLDALKTYRQDAIIHVCSSSELRPTSNRPSFSPGERHSTNSN